MQNRPQTPHEERLNGISHLVGIIWSICIIPYCMYIAYDANDLMPFLSVAIFAIGMLAVYTSSTLYHITTDLKRKMILKKFDHISIYFLIAGTYAPFIAHFVPKNTAIIFLIIMWSIVAIGIVYKLFFILRFKWFSLFLYLALGWMIVFVAKPLQENMPLSVFLWIVIGGIFYTAGVYFYVKSAKPYFHSIWHLFVLAGTIAHTIGVYVTLTHSLI